jgi:hypothetical protein
MCVQAAESRCTSQTSTALAQALRGQQAATQPSPFDKTTTPSHHLSTRGRPNLKHQHAAVYIATTPRASSAPRAMTMRPDECSVETGTQERQTARLLTARQ